MLHIEERYVTTDDGATLATYTCGPASGTWVVLSNGLGGNILAWRHLLAHFHDRYRFVSWDYRGLYKSTCPCCHDDDSVSIWRQSRDLRTVLELYKIRHAVFVGWSMGVQVNLELYRQTPEAFLALVLINGTWGRVFDQAFRSRVMSVAGPVFLAALERMTIPMNLLGPLLTRNRAVVAAAKAVGLVSPTLDEEVFRELSSDFVGMDFEIYARTFRALSAHDASDILSAIRVPTLIIAGQRDLFTPAEVSEDIARRIPDAELLVVKGGTHYTPIEYPMTVNLRIEKFFRERIEPILSGTRGKKPRPVRRRRAKTRNAPGAP